MTALRAALVDGTIDIVATDHAPHPIEDKECEWESAAFGMVGLETAFSIVYSTMVASGAMSWDRLASVMSIAPASIGRYANHGQHLEVGKPAHITVVNPQGSITINKDDLASKSKNTPFHGMNFQGTVVATIFNGLLTHKVGE